LAGVSACEECLARIFRLDLASIIALPRLDRGRAMTVSQ
jgi:hypothetical protein